MFSNNCGINNEMLWKSYWKRTLLSWKSYLRRSFVKILSEQKTSVTFRTLFDEIDKKPSRLKMNAHLINFQRAINIVYFWSLFFNSNMSDKCNEESLRQINDLANNKEQYQQHFSKFFCESLQVMSLCF